MRKRWRKITTVLYKICLVDWILMLFLAILLFYTALHLLDGTATGESNTVDILIRTSASAIFGYFISGNFQKGVISAAIQSTDSTGANPMKAESANSAGGRGNKIQIIIVSGVGMSSLALLLFVRSYTDVTPEFAATVSQLRDFVAACVGFLISCGKQTASG